MKVDILAHRGWWTSREDQNSLAALSRAFRAGFGVETDIRDCDGHLVISHDMPRYPVLSLNDLLEEYAKTPQSGPLALNVKADGMAESLLEALQCHGISNYFVFDMSVPDTLHYLRGEANVFMRRSEYERGSLLDAQGQGLWLDAFVASSVPIADLDYARTMAKDVALVSPELHKMPHEEAWRVWREFIETAGDSGQRCMVCTDFPDKADNYFNTPVGHQQ
ncbi:hypothetical protein [Brevundimonas sp.]|uniref:hypothetical protein n=1 Tax=Brevundimonas sp. TaxID=1871086 RepID=UPI003D151C68